MVAVLQPSKTNKLTQSTAVGKMPTKRARTFTLTKIMFFCGIFSYGTNWWFRRLKFNRALAIFVSPGSCNFTLRGSYRTRIPHWPKKQARGSHLTCQREYERSLKYFLLHFPDSRRPCCSPKWNEVSTYDILLGKCELSIYSRIKFNKNAYKS